MKAHRIWGAMLRHLFVMKHSLHRWSASFYWPTLDLLLWGLTITYAKSLDSHPSQIVATVISGLLLWLIVWRGQYEISVNILEDIWSKNLINMFSSPLSFWEYIVTFIFLGFTKAAVSFSFACAMAYLLYQVKIFMFGFYLLPFIALLFMTGWSVGFFVGGLILRYGTKVEQFAWSMISLLAPFSAVYYPLTILPTWAQKIALFIPTSYVFEGAREVIATGQLDGNKVAISLGINVVYLVLSIWYMRRSFAYALRGGLAKIY